MNSNAPYFSGPATIAAPGRTTCRRCRDAPPGPVLLAVRQFNSRQWYECHETLETLWLVETGEVRDLYRGIIQVAIALHHWRNGNFNGAVKLLESGCTCLERVVSPCMWLDVAHLIRQAGALRAMLLEPGETEMTAVAPEAVPRLTTVSVSLPDGPQTA